MTNSQKAIINEIELFAKTKNVPIIQKDAASVLCEVCARRKPQSILEIGTAIGYSGALMLLNSAPDSRLTTIDISEPAIKQAVQNFDSLKLTSRVEIVMGDCIEVLKGLKDSYDFVFLDGPKALYIECLPLILKLCSKGSVIVADNMNYGKREHADMAEDRKRRVVGKLTEFINAVKDNPMLEDEFLDIGDGIALINVL